MLKENNKLFRTSYWVSLNAPYFVSAFIMTIATFEENIIFSLFMLLVPICILSSILTLDKQINQLRKFAKSLPRPNIEDFTNIKKENGIKYATVTFILGIAVMLPSFFNQSQWSISAFILISIYLYVTQMKLNAQVIPSFVLGCLYNTYYVRYHQHNYLYILSLENDEKVWQINHSRNKSNKDLLAANVLLQF